MLVQTDFMLNNIFSRACVFNIDSYNINDKIQISRLSSISAMTVMNMLMIDFEPMFSAATTKDVASLKNLYVMKSSVIILQFKNLRLEAIEFARKISECSQRQQNATATIEKWVHNNIVFEETQTIDSIDSISCICIAAIPTRCWWEFGTYHLWIQNSPDWKIVFLNHDP